MGLFSGELFAIRPHRRFGRIVSIRPRSSGDVIRYNVNLPNSCNLGPISAKSRSDLTKTEEPPYSGGSSKYLILFQIDRPAAAGLLPSANLPRRDAGLLARLLGLQLLVLFSALFSALL